MDTIDPATAAWVWQRVRAEEPEAPREEGLKELIAREWEAAATYLQLSRHFQGRQNALLRKLFTQEQAHAACLKGLYSLLTGKRPAVAGVKPVEDDPMKVLRRCYGRQMQCLARYEQRTNDPEYGHVFARLAQQEKEHCHILLEIIGNLK
jgi:rubrerythrin